MCTCVSETDRNGRCLDCGELQNYKLSASPACSIAEPLFVALYPQQRKKIKQLVDDGALIIECLVTLKVPHRGECTVDRYGRVVWSN